MTHDQFVALVVVALGVTVTGFTHHRPILQNGVQRGLDIAVAVCIVFAVGRALRLF